MSRFGNNNHYFSYKKNARPSSSSNSANKGVSRLKAAKHLGVSSSEFDILVNNGKMPRWRWVDGRKVGYLNEIDRAPPLPAKPSPFDEIWFGLEIVSHVIS
jgi:hypothetical protein